MSGDRKGILIAGLIWIVIAAILAVAAKFLILPYFQEELEDETGSQSRYKNEILLAADSFSGYCVLRSSAIQKDLTAQGIKLTIQDDQADYEARMKALEKKAIHMALFTIDSFIITGAKLEKFPASIVFVIDETKGADALIAYKNAVKSIEDLDHPDARIVLTPRSPSEFLARTVIAHFSLPNLPDKWLVEADGAEAVYKKIISADKSKKWAYALWEPYVSKALEEAPDAHILLDSSKLKGYIIDVLVAERTFLRDHADLAQAVIEAYLRAAFAYQHNPEGMTLLVMEDAKTTGGEALSKKLADKLTQGIAWKNTMENYAYFGLLSSQDNANLQHLEDSIVNITDVLVKTGALTSDPLNGKAHTLFYDQIMKNLYTANFHPGKQVNLIQDFGSGTQDLAQPHRDIILRPLSDKEWASLAPVGRMQIEPISFARGTARINIESERNLKELARKLAGWPYYYLKVAGHARAEGDPQANIKLAEERANAVAQLLTAYGVDKARIKASAATPSSQNGAAQSVSFLLMQAQF
ncbi:MAG: phosphate ABC transporter substrate-binding/OmpA family protein [Pseudomonadota bacterium]